MWSGARSAEHAVAHHAERAHHLPPVSSSGRIGARLGSLSRPSQPDFGQEASSIAATHSGCTLRSEFLREKQSRPSAECGRRKTADSRQANQQRGKTHGLEPRCVSTGQCRAQHAQLPTPKHKPRPPNPGFTQRSLHSERAYKSATIRLAPDIRSSSANGFASWA